MTSLPICELLIWPTKQAEISAEDELASAQAKAAEEVTVKKLHRDEDIEFLAMRAALEARMKRYKSASKEANQFRKARWGHERYLLDFGSEAFLLQESSNRSFRLQATGSGPRCALEEAVT